MIDEAKLSELEELAKAATPGPWQKLDCGGIHKTGEWTHQGNVPPDSIICVAQGWNELEQPEPSLQIKDADRDYISAANPTAILSLIAALRKAIEQRNDVLSGLTRSHLDDIAEYQEKNDAELLAILNVEGE